MCCLFSCVQLFSILWTIDCLAPHKHMLVLTLCMCLSVQISRWQFALQHQFSDRSKKHHQFLVCTTIYYYHGTDGFYTLIDTEAETGNPLITIDKGLIYS